MEKEAGKTGIPREVRVPVEKVVETYRQAVSAGDYEGAATQYGAIAGVLEQFSRLEGSMRDGIAGLVAQNFEELSRSPEKMVPLTAILAGVRPKEGYTAVSGEYIVH